MRRSGFTLTEVLVALAILTVIVVSLLTAQTRILKAENRVRSRTAWRHEARRILTQTHLGASVKDIAEGLKDDWTVEMDVVESDSGTNRIQWHRWRLTPIADASTRAEFFLVRSP